MSMRVNRTEKEFFLNGYEIAGSLHMKPRFAGVMEMTLYSNG